MSKIKIQDGQYKGPSGVIYTELEAASELLGQNRSQIDPDEVEELADERPMNLNIDFAVLERYLFMPTTETIRFARLALSEGLQPRVDTFRDTGFTTTNPEKVAALRPTYLWPKGQTTKGWLVTPENRVGSIGARPTVFGISIEDYWAQVRRVRSQSTDLQAEEAIWLRGRWAARVGVSTRDNSKWYARLSARAGDTKVQSSSYYTPRSAAYLTYAALFEDFEGGPNGLSLQAFVQNRVVPAQEELWKKFGAVPIIVRLPAASDNLEVDMRNLTAEANKTLEPAGQEFAA